MSQAVAVIKFIFYAFLLILGLLLVWTVWNEYVKARNAVSNAGVTAYSAAHSWGIALRNALDPTKDSFFFWKLPVISWTKPISTTVEEKLHSWFGVPSNQPGGSANPMNQSPTGEQAVLLNANFPPSITRQITPVVSQPDPVMQPASSITGTSGTDEQTPVDNVLPFYLPAQSEGA